jgi:hypothetical protein
MQMFLVLQSNNATPRYLTVFLLGQRKLYSLLSTTSMAIRYLLTKENKYNTLYFVYFVF